MQTGLRILALLLCLIPLKLYAQANQAQGLSIEEIEADKKRIIALNMQLTEQEGPVFWPIYEAYQKDLGKLDDRTVKLLQTYANSYDMLTDEQAKSLLDEYFEIETQRLLFKKSYVSKLSAVLPMKRVARYLQLENKIEAISNYGVASVVPLAK
jgi:hypothetical protein